ncbi:MAG: DNA repair protein RecO [Bacillota bacterium]|nr:DNA repair protein RecO [Bacillota bacterium]
MSYTNTKGIVIREVSTGEADKIVTIFSRYSGKMTGFAKGAKRPKGALAAGTQLLCYSDFVMYKGKDMYNIQSSEVIEPFYEIRNDIEKLTYAAHFVDIINDIILENQPAAKVLQLFLNTLHMLSKTDRTPGLLARIFELRVLSLIGYAPYVKGCMECGSSDLDIYSFSFRKCGCLCSKCCSKDEYAMKLAPGTYMALNHIIYAPLKELFNFSVSQEVLYELEKLSRRYLKDRLEKDYNKLDFLKELKL